MKLLDLDQPLDWFHSYSKKAPEWIAAPKLGEVASDPVELASRARRLGLAADMVFQKMGKSFSDLREAPMVCESYYPELDAALTYFIFKFDNNGETFVVQD